MTPRPWEEHGSKLPRSAKRADQQTQNRLPAPEQAAEKKAGFQLTGNRRLD